jgi:hypothetical protein
MPKAREMARYAPKEEEEEEEEEEGGVVMMGAVEAAEAVEAREWEEAEEGMGALVWWRLLLLGPAL